MTISISPKKRPAERPPRNLPYQITVPAKRVPFRRPHALPAARDEIRELGGFRNDDGQNDAIRARGTTRWFCRPQKTSPGFATNLRRLLPVPIKTEKTPLTPVPDPSFHPDNVLGEKEPGQER